MFIVQFFSLSCLLSLIISNPLEAKLIKGLDATETIKIQEIKEVLSSTKPSKATMSKLGDTLHSVLYELKPDLTDPGLRYNEQLGKYFFRVVHWNIYNLDFKYLSTLLNSRPVSKHSFDVQVAQKKVATARNARVAFGDNSDFQNKSSKNNSSTDLELLKSTDIFILNSADWQTERSGFKNNVEEFANLMHGHYAFVPEFIEASPSLLKRIPQETIEPQEQKKELNPYLAHLETQKNSFKLSANFKSDDFKGLHGNAIVSKFPINRLGKIRLPACYNWFEEEGKYLQDRSPDKLRKKIKDRAGEGYIDEIRRGGRVALTAEIILPNNEPVLVISTQLENRASPACREMQLHYLLSYIQGYKNPIILGAGLNNFEKNSGPFYLGKAIKQTVTDPQVLAKKAITYLNPFAFITNLSSTIIGGYRKKNNPTVSNVPIFMRNRAAKIFRNLEKFQFSDGNKFDFAGIEEFNYSNSEKLLANSNQRGKKGFITTYEYKKLFGKAKVKIDWIFVKPLADRHRPMNPRTLHDFNYQFEALPIAEHSPILVDVML
ncbi:MAG: hypothetical protein O2962_02005 [Cyanobacteria bacterium]|nr:hypothetical protein [Cyanobacteriota bacterium]